LKGLVQDELVFKMTPAEPPFSQAAASLHEDAAEATGQPGHRAAFQLKENS
jgi:hypothetical protein